MLLVAVLCALTSAVAADTDPLYAALVRSELNSLPTGGELAVDGGELTAFARSAPADLARSSIVEVAGQPFGRAFRFEVLQPTQPAYRVLLSSPGNKVAVRRADLLLVCYFARCPESRAESGGGHLAGHLELAKDPWTGTGSFAGTPGRTWQRRYARATAERDFAPGELHLSIHLGQYAQTIELGGISLFRFPANTDPRALPVSTITYAGREPDAPWRQAAAQRIEMYRKGELAVTVTDAQGRPMPGVRVRARMTRHAYQFGTFLEGPALWANADGERYRQTVLKLFNRATCPTYWADWGWPKQEEHYLALARWARENRLHIRGHNLIWPSWRWTPSALRKLETDPEALRRAVAESIRERCRTFRPFEFDDYDVINELRDNHEIVDLLGPGITAEWFRLARETDPEPVLGINDYSILTRGGNTQGQQDIYLEQIRGLREQGAPLGLIGFQCHFGEDLTPPDKVLHILDRFAATGLPLHATELDISTDDEAAQADYLRDFITVFFSHPATTAITQWGFWEGQHWIPRAALLRRDWTPKPSGQAYMDLVLRDWWTDESGLTGADGTWRVRGFLGDYAVGVQDQSGQTGVQVTLGHAGARVHITDRGRP